MDHAAPLRGGGWGWWEAEGGATGSRGQRRARGEPAMGEATACKGDVERQGWQQRARGGGAVGGGPVMAGGTNVGREERRGGEDQYENEEEEKNEKGGARSIGHPALSITIYFIDQKI